MNTKIEKEASVLVSGEGIMATFQGMNEKCKFIDLLDFCNLAEAIVLNDKIEIVCDIEYAHALSFDTNIRKLMDAGVVSEFTTHRGVQKSKKNNTKPSLNTTRDLNENSNRNKKSLGTFSLDQIMDEATSLLRAERELNVSVLPMHRFAPLYIPNARVREEHTICDLMSRYEDLSKKIRLIREKNRYQLSPLIITKIPPIPVTVLKHANSGKEILDRILDIRGDFKHLRESISSLRRDLSNEEINPKEKRKIIDSWSRSWQTLQKFDECSQIAIGNTPNEIVDIDKSVDSESIELKLSKVLDLILKGAKIGLRRWRVRMLHNTADQYLKICDGQIMRDLNRLYNREFGDKDLRELKDWEKMISMMTIDLEGMSPKKDYVIESSI